MDPPQQPPAMEEPAAAAPYTLVSEHAVPEPIEMPPPKSQVDVTEVLAAVQGSFNFVQDSMVEYECKSVCSVKENGRVSVDS